MARLLPLSLPRATCAWSVRKSHLLKRPQHTHLQRTGQPKCTKEVTAELGNVTPYIIVPGPWSDTDIAYHAANVAAGLANNNGHNCLAAEVRLVRGRSQQFVRLLVCFAGGVICSGSHLPHSCIPSIRL